jgi:acetyl esterase/lipase
VYIIRLLMAGIMHLWSPVPALNAVAPLDGIAVTTDARYAEGPRHGLDVYAPVDAAGASVVVFLYGGGWETGDKAMYRFVGAGPGRGDPGLPAAPGRSISGIHV